MKVINKSARSVGLAISPAIVLDAKQSVEITPEQAKAISRNCQGLLMSGLIVIDHELPAVDINVEELYEYDQEGEPDV